VTLDGYDGERMLFHYDVSGAARSVAARVCQIVFGQRRSDGASGGVHSTPGFIQRPGVVWIGQSVLVLPPKDATELASRLRRMGVKVALGPVGISREVLRAFVRLYEER